MSAAVDPGDRVIVRDEGRLHNVRTRLVTASAFQQGPQQPQGLDCTVAEKGSIALCEMYMP